MYREELIPKLNTTMQKLILAFSLLLFSFSVLLSQTREERYLKLRTPQLKVLQDLVREDNAAALAKKISYPLRRSSWLPDIKTEAEFVVAYPYLFDAEMKQLFCDPDILENDGWFVKDVYLAVLNGGLWIGSEGKIGILSTSAYESGIISSAYVEIHPSVRTRFSFGSVILTDKNILLLDAVDRQRVPSITTQFAYVNRLSIWKQPKSFSDEPDQVLLEKRQVDKGGFVDEKGAEKTCSVVEYQSGERSYQIETIYSTGLDDTKTYVFTVFEGGRVIEKQNGVVFPVMETFAPAECQSRVSF